MDEMQFWKLYNILYKYDPENGKKRKHGKQNSTSANGKIHVSLCLSIDTRYFAGGSPYNLMISHDAGYSDMYHSVWKIVNTINLCDDLKFLSQQVMKNKEN